MQLVECKSNNSVNGFAKSITIAQQTVNRLFNIDSRTKKYPTATTEMLVAIISNYHDVNAGWLLTGEGKMLKKSECDKENDVELSEKDSNLTKKYEELKVMYNDERERVNKLLSVVEKQQAMIDKLSKDEGVQGGATCVDVG